MNEREIERVAGKLGSRAALEIDPDRTAQAVLHRLRTDPKTRPHPWWAAPAVLRVAAVLVLAIGGGLGVRAYLGQPDGAETVPVITSSLESLTVAELGEVFDSLDFDTPVYELVGAGLEDLDEGQLEELLLQLEG